MEVLSHSCSSRSQDEGAFEMDCFEVLAITQTPVLRACLGVQVGKGSSYSYVLDQKSGREESRLLDSAYDDQE